MIKKIVQYLYDTYEYIIYDKNNDIGFKEIDNFLTLDECNILINYMENTPNIMEQSMVDKGTFIDFGKINLIDRNSKQCWISGKDLNIVKEIQRRIRSYINIDGNNGTNYMQEKLQLVKYTPGGFFKAHYDEKKTLFHKYNRDATFLIYLNDNFIGGETRFTNLGLSIIPKAGKAIYFKNINEVNKNILYYSKHEGTSVKNGNKYIANLWIHIIKNEY